MISKKKPTNLKASKSFEKNQTLEEGGSSLIKNLNSNQNLIEPKQNNINTAFSNSISQKESKPRTAVVVYDFTPRK